MIRSWLSDTSAIVVVRRRVGDPQAEGKLGPRLDAALACPTFLLVAPAAEGGGAGGKRHRSLCPKLLRVFAAFAAPAKKARRGQPDSPAASAEAADAAFLAAAAAEEEVQYGAGGYEEEDVEAFRAASPGSLPGSGSRGGAAGAQAFRRNSALSGGSGGTGALAQALLGPSPVGARSRGSGGSDLFPPMQGGDLPEEEDWAGGGGGGGRLSRPFQESALAFESARDATQAGPAAALSGVSAGVAQFFSAAFAAESQEADKVFGFAELCGQHSLSRSQAAQLFAQVLILASNDYVAVAQAAPYADIDIKKGGASF